MQIYYCEKCGLRIQQDDLDAGRVRVSPENLATCLGCQAHAPASTAPAIPAHLPRSTPTRTAPSQRVTREATGGKSRSKSPVLLVAAGAAVLGLALALSGGGKKDDSAPSTDSAAASTPAQNTPQPNTAKTTEPAKTNEVKVEAPVATGSTGPAVTGGTDSGAVAATKMQSPEDFREGFALRRWTHLKTILEQPGNEWAVAASVREFIDSHGSTVPGKEAAAWFTAALGSTAAQSTVVASYRRDFAAEKSAAGWSYHWNKDGPLGQATNYAPLVWNTKRASFAIDAKSFPLGKPGAYTFAGPTEVHPGNGTQDGTPFDRYVITAYTLQPGQEGKWALKVMARRRVGSQSDIELCVLVNNAFRGKVKGPASEMTGPLGTLGAGDTVYVAIGPNQDCGSDGTDLEWVLYKVD